MRALLIFLFSTVTVVPEPLVERPVRPWEFLDATGPKAAWLGHEDGTLEAYVWPLKILKDLHLSFRLGSRVIPGPAIARTVSLRPGTYTIHYSGDEFTVAQMLTASPTEPGVLMRLVVESSEPIETLVEFTRDFQPMWPASIGSGYVAWDEKSKVWRFGADGHPFAAVLGSPTGAVLTAEYYTNYSNSTSSVFSLGTVNGRGERALALAGSVKSADEAMATYRRLVDSPKVVEEAARKYYFDYLARTTRISVPDPMIQQAYDWARIATFKGIVENPMLGRGLVAGYGPSKGLYRPGFAWFFGRDSFWTSLALTISGDHDSARDAIDFIAKFQREDGKIPHEISQSAALIPWWKDYPYGYASADATPLYVIAVRDYLNATGDTAFARKHWPGVQKALRFMESTLEPAGFPKNYEVGHGWVEGGVLLPVRVEFYQAGCYVEALRSAAAIARAVGDASADDLARQFAAKQKSLNDTFWVPGSKAYAFALGLDGRPVSQPSVLATVPMWFGVTDGTNSRTMIEQLAREEHATDWGMRIISARSPQFGPAGYHFGSVWPLFTGWASVGEYRQHMAATALSNLQANAWLTLDGAAGVTTEVLSGASYSPLSTSSPHQIWSSAMVLSSVLRGLFGLRVDAAANRVALEPHLPAAWTHAEVNNVQVGTTTLDFVLGRTDAGCTLQVTNHGLKPVEVEFAPAEPVPATVISARVNGQLVKWTERREEVDWHPVLSFTVAPGSTTASIDDRDWFAYTVPYNSPALGHTSSNLKVLSERWTGQDLELTLSGRPGTVYRLPVRGRMPESVEGASVEAPGLLTVAPEGTGDDYVTQKIRLRFSGKRQSR